MKIQWLALASALLPVACAGTSSQTNDPAPHSSSAQQLPNPASVNCVQRGGTRLVERTPAGDEYSVCTFPENRQCEEWALFRSECPVGGIRVTGYTTAAARYCAIRGNKYSVVAHNGEQTEQGLCTLPGGKTCDANEYYRSGCVNGAR